MSYSLWGESQTGPLEHLRVIDLTIMLPGPFITQILAHYGADVIKVEQYPQGDALRQIPSCSLAELLLSGKKSVALNLKTPEAVEIIKRLASEADVFVENFREGVMDRLGIGYSALSQENPDLLYLSIRGFSGTKSPLAGHDINFIANSGCGEWFLETGSPNYSAQFGDLVGGAFLPLIQLFANLSNPHRGGTHLVTYMDQGFRSLYLPRAYDFSKAETAPENERLHYGVQKMIDGSLPINRYYRCRDGYWISLATVQEKHWDAFCEMIEKPEWKNRGQDPTLCTEIEKVFSESPSTYWESLSEKKDVCLIRVIPWAEHFNAAKSQILSDPFTWIGLSKSSHQGHFPKLGEHSLQILQKMGYTQSTIQDYLQKKIVFTPEA